jgi:pimeloyl-ACP methyl ester carboxylesterase
MVSYRIAFLRRSAMTRMRLLGAAVVSCAALAVSGGSAAALSVHWMSGFKAPGTPAKYNRVGILKVGPARAKNVLVLEPGTSAGGGYFIPLAQWIVAKTHGWQVWSVERRENLVEDHSELNLAKRGKASGSALFNYYLGYLTNPAVTRHVAIPSPSAFTFAKGWGMNVAVQDLRRVIGAARQLGGKVVLGGHSLGGSVVAAYATWNFGGKPGARDLAGLVFIDGSSFRTETATQARAGLQALNAPKATPWLTFGGIPSPYAGLFVMTGSEGVLIDPNSPSIGQQFSLLPSGLKPSVPVTNLGQFGFALNATAHENATQQGLAASQAHLGRGIASAGPVHGWDGTGALTPIKRFATMFATPDLQNVDGSEWYFPQRLTNDTAAVANGIPNPAQSVLNVQATLGRKLPHRLRMYAFATSLGSHFVIDAVRQLARQSHIPSRNVILINRASTYAHNDPNGAYPHNVFFAHLLPFLRGIGAG